MNLNRAFKVVLVLFLAGILSQSSVAGKRGANWKQSNFQTQQQQIHNAKRKEQANKNFDFKPGHVFRCSTPAQAATLVLMASVAYWCLMPETVPASAPESGPKDLVKRSSRALAEPFGVAELQEVPCLVQGALPQRPMSELASAFVHPGLYSAKNGALNRGQEQLVNDCVKLGFMKNSDAGYPQCFPDQNYKRVWEFDESQEECGLYDRDFSDLVWQYLEEEVLQEKNPLAAMFEAKNSKYFVNRIQQINAFFNGQFDGLAQFVKPEEGNIIVRKNIHFPGIAEVDKWEGYINEHQTESIASFRELTKIAANISKELKKLFPDLRGQDLSHLEALPSKTRFSAAVSTIIARGLSDKFAVLHQNFDIIPARSSSEYIKILGRLRKETFTMAKGDAIAAAAYFHTEFVKLHPFHDGNGRVARTMMNLILMSSGIDAVFFPSNREYMEATNASIAEKSSVAFESFLRKIIIVQKNNEEQLNSMAKKLEKCKADCQHLVDELL